MLCTWLAEAAGRSRVDVEIGVQKRSPLELTAARTGTDVTFLLAAGVSGRGHGMAYSAFDDRDLKPRVRLLRRRTRPGPEGGGCRASKRSSTVDARDD